MLGADDHARERTPVRGHVADDQIRPDLARAPHDIPGDVQRCADNPDALRIVLKQRGKIVRADSFGIRIKTDISIIEEIC